MNAGQKFCRAFAVSRKPGRGGRRLEPCGPRANFADMSWRACRQCGGELFGAPVFPEKYGEYADEQKRSCSCRTAEILPEHPRDPARNVASEFSTFLWRHEALGSPHAVMANMGGLLGPFPTAGNGPRRTRRLRGTLSTEHDPVVFQYRAGKPAEILPPDDSGSRRVKPSSDGRGGRSKPCPEPAVANSLKFSRNKGTLFARQTELFAPACGRCLVAFRENDHETRQPLRPPPLPRPPTRSLCTEALAGRPLSASLVEIDISENEFQCQLNSSFFPLFFLKKLFLIVHDWDDRAPKDKNSYISTRSTKDEQHDVLERRQTGVIVAGNSENVAF